MKRVICVLLCLVLSAPLTALAAEDGIGYPHYMYRMEVENFGEDFLTLGKTYNSYPIISSLDPVYSYSLFKAEGNDYVYFQSDGLGGWSEDSYATLLNAVEAYFGADTAQDVRESFDLSEFGYDTKMSEKEGNYTFSLTAGNNHRGYAVRINRKPIFLDLVGWDPDYQSDVDSVIALFGEGIIKGVGDNNFAPNANISRAEFVSMFTRMIGVQGGEYKGSFADVPEGAWYTGAVEAFADMGYISGYDDGDFHPSDTISYQDMFVITYRYLLDNELLSGTGGYSIKISDHVSGFSDYAVTAIDELYGRGLLNYQYLEKARDSGTRIDIACFLNGIRGHMGMAAPMT